MTDSITAQEIFNTVWDHFVVKNAPRSLRDGNDNVCMYRGVNGAKCAAGLLMSDAEVAHLGEGNGVNRGCGDYLPVRLRPHYDLIVSLQDAHDQRAFEGPERAHMLSRIAQTYHLVVPS